MSEWIKCSERMPKHGDLVLCSGRFIPKVLQFRRDLGHTGAGGGFGEHRPLKRGGYEIVWIDRVTHWMPLPAPPTDSAPAAEGDGR